MYGNVNYIGINVTEINGSKVDNLHITLEFFKHKDDRAKSINDAFNLIGKEVSGDIIQSGFYFKDADVSVVPENLALRVVLPLSVVPLFKNKIPHITTFVKEGSKAVYSEKCFTAEHSIILPFEGKWKGTVGLHTYKDEWIYEV